MEEFRHNDSQKSNINIPVFHQKKILLHVNKVQLANTLVVGASSASHWTWDLGLPVTINQKSYINDNGTKAEICTYSGKN